MDLELGSHRFSNVEIPILWGDRAIIADKMQRLAVINLAGGTASLEILAGKPAAGVPYEPVGVGFKILDKASRSELYVFDPALRVLTSISLSLPEIQIGDNMVRVGTNRFSANMISGSEVGISVRPDGIGLGLARLPEGLARLKI